MSEVLLINIHGGFPSAMTKRMVEELDSFREFAEHSEFYERAYPTNACAGPALHDIVMDAPLGTMSDNVWHSWSHQKTASRTLFHIFQQNGYRTQLFGMFGLDRRFDPHTHMHARCSHLDTALQTYGVDECESQDAAFTCQLALAHDREAIKRLVASLRDPSRPQKNATMINLLGCQDIHKCTFHDVDPHRMVIPSMKFEKGQYDERIFATSVVDDDPRRTDASRQGIDALYRACRLHDWIRGVDGGGMTREELVRTTYGLHRFCWKCIEQLDAGLSDIVEALRERNRLDDAVIYVFTDHPLSLYEHGEFCDAPWDACLRGFLMRRAPRTTPRRVDAPISLANLPLMLFSDCDIHCDWHVTPARSDTTMTLGFALSWLARAGLAPRCSPMSLRTFFERFTVVHNARVYALVFWFSLIDLATVSGHDTNRTAPNLSKLFEKQASWINPVLNWSLQEFSDRRALQVYEHSSDPQELNNLAFESTNWCASETARAIKLCVDDAIRHHRIEKILLSVPQNAQALTPETVSLCSVQLHNRVRETIYRLPNPPYEESPNASEARETMDAGTQTEDISFIKALNEAFGADISSAISSQLGQTAHGPLTVFAPDGLDADARLPNWVPVPLHGALASDAMLNAADKGYALKDVVGNTQQLTRTMSGSNVLLRRCRILLQSATNLMYTGGMLVGYRVHEEASTANESQVLDYDKASDATGDSNDEDSLAGASEQGATSVFEAGKKKSTSRNRHSLQSSRTRSTTRVDTTTSGLQHQQTSSIRGSVKAKEAGQSVRHRR